MGHSHHDLAAYERRPWNLGRLVGAKRALKRQQVWAIRFWLDGERRLRNLALFNLAMESKLRGCDFVRPRSRRTCWPRIGYFRGRIGGAGEGFGERAKGGDGEGGRQGALTGAGAAAGMDSRLARALASAVAI
jgi:hypothetical protein